MPSCKYCKKEIKRFNWLGQEIKIGGIGDVFDWEYCNKAERRALEFKQGRELGIWKNDLGMWSSNLKSTPNGDTYVCSVFYAEDALSPGEFKDRVFQSLGMKQKEKEYPDVVAWYNALEKLK